MRSFIKPVDLGKDPRLQRVVQSIFQRLSQQAYKPHLTLNPAIFHTGQAANNSLANSRPAETLQTCVSNREKRNRFSDFPRSGFQPVRRLRDVSITKLSTYKASDPVLVLFAHFSQGEP